MSLSDERRKIIEDNHQIDDNAPPYLFWEDLTSHSASRHEDESETYGVESLGSILKSDVPLVLKLRQVQDHLRSQRVLFPLKEKSDSFLTKVRRESTRSTGFEQKSSCSLEPSIKNCKLLRRRTLPTLSRRDNHPPITKIHTIGHKDKEYTIREIIQREEQRWGSVHFEDDAFIPLKLDADVCMCDLFPSPELRPATASFSPEERAEKKEFINGLVFIAPTSTPEILKLYR